MTLPAPFTKYDPASSSWKTCEDSLPLAMDGYSDEFSARWPISGMTRSGAAFELPTSAPRTLDSASSSSLTRGTSSGSLLPTPRAGDGMHSPLRPHALDTSRLEDAVAVHLLPTPAVNDMGKGKTIEAWDEWTAKMKAAHGNGNGHGKSLHIEALRVGESTVPQSDAGKPSRGEPHPLQPALMSLDSDD